MSGARSRSSSNCGNSRVEKDAVKKTLVLAYSGGARSAAAVAWLGERFRADVITLTLDLGETKDLADIRERAVSDGAARAHVIDARDEFVRDMVLPSLKAG